MQQATMDRDKEVNPDTHEYVGEAAKMAAQPRFGGMPFPPAPPRDVPVEVREAARAAAEEAAAAAAEAAADEGALVAYGGGGGGCGLDDDDLLPRAAAPPRRTRRQRVHRPVVSSIPWSLLDELEAEKYKLESEKAVAKLKGR